MPAVAKKRAGAPAVVRPRGGGGGGGRHWLVDLAIKNYADVAVLLAAALIAGWTFERTSPLFANIVLIQYNLTDTNSTEIGRA